jgi:alpha-L-fucosidase
MRAIRATTILVLLPAALLAQGISTPSAANLEARAWFQDAKFGMFIHWGISALLMDGEWVMENRGIDVAEYERIAVNFDARNFDADAWVTLARSAGGYITLITKHHDGFALFDSDVTDWDVVDRTPFGRDIVREMAEACRRQGLRLFVYYSQLDWHHPDYFPRGRTGRRTGRPDGGSWDRYLEFMDAQLRELFSNYGPLGGVWLDGMWDRPDADWHLERTYRRIHDLQPAALIIPNHRTCLGSIPPAGTVRLCPPTCRSKHRRRSVIRGDTGSPMETSSPYHRWFGCSSRLRDATPTFC